MTKADLKTGMFGRTNLNCWFVVVNDLLVYEDGDFDNISDMRDDLSFGGGYAIVYLVYAYSFEHARTIKSNSGRCVMSRSVPVVFKSKKLVELKLGYEFVIEEE